ncbi:MAG TPA: lipase family protein [Acidimicrobiales bacterium]
MSHSTRGRRAARRALALVLAACLVGACTGDGDGDARGGAEAADEKPASPEPEAFTGDDFYALPDPLPEGDHGDLIRYQQVDGPEGGDGATHWRVMYLSESLSGDPIAVTGTVTVPDGDPPEAGRELVAIAHGTTGIADECAPSKGDGVGEGALAGLASERGYVLAITDYEGLGTPGRHPYLVGESEGRSVLDAALAAAQVPGAEVGDRFAVAGYSQGGHGALWAGQLAEEWAPDLELVGTFAGAPATELPLIFGAAESMPIVGFLYMIIAGFEAAYPDEADPSVVLTDAGLEALAEVDDGCAGEVLPRLGALPREDLLRPGVGSVEPWATLAAENDPGRVVTDSPILIVHSAADDVVPAALSQILFDRMCGLGQQVERRVYDTGQGHGEAAPQAYVDGFDWIGDRFAGEPATSTCG